MLSTQVDPEFPEAPLNSVLSLSGLLEGRSKAVGDGSCLSGVCGTLYFPKSKTNTNQQTKNQKAMGERHTAGSAVPRCSSYEPYGYSQS